MTCSCALCTGAKKYENLDICDNCRALLMAEGSKPLTVEQRVDFALGNLRLSGSEATEEMVLAAATKTAKPH